MDSIEATKAIRNELKKCGYSNRKVSVKHQYGGYSASIRVTVKDLSINLASIRKIARSYEEIDYDERTGEVLQGGNTYIFVEYDYTVLDNATDKKMEEATQLIHEMENLRPNEFYRVLDESEFYIANLCKGDSIGYDITLAYIRFTTKKNECNYPQPTTICITHVSQLAQYLALYDYEKTDKEVQAS